MIVDHNLIELNSLLNHIHLLLHKGHIGFKVIITLFLFFNFFNSSILVLCIGFKKYSNCSLLFNGIELFGPI